MASWHTSVRRRARTRGVPDEVHAAGIAMEAVADDRDVDIDDVAALQALIARDAVAHHVVDRGANGLRESRGNSDSPGSDFSSSTMKSWQRLSSSSVVTPGWT